MLLETNCNAVVMVTLKSPYRQDVEKGGGVPALLLQTTTDILLSYICNKYKKINTIDLFFTLNRLIIYLCTQYLDVPD